MSIIKLKASDGEIIEVDLEVARCSGSIRNKLEERGEEDMDKPLDIKKVNSAILKKVIEWMTRYKDDPLIVVNEEKREIKIRLGAWDEEFLSSDLDNLDKIVLAAADLDIESLVDVITYRKAKILQEGGIAEIQKCLKSFLKSLQVSTEKTSGYEQKSTTAT